MPNKNAPDPAINTPQAYGQYSSYNAATTSPVPNKAKQITPTTTAPAKTQPDADAIALARAARIELGQTPPAQNRAETATPDAEFQNHPNNAPIMDAIPQPGADTNAAAAAASPIPYHGEGTPGYPHPLDSLTPLDEPTLPGHLSNL